jgi:endonuclease-3
MAAMTKRTSADRRSGPPLSAVEICRRLRRRHGPVEPPEQWPVLDELIGALLSQNTSDNNSDAAFQQLLRTFPTWNDVRQARVDRIARAIRPAGLQQRKAPRIKRILQEVYERHGELSLEFLHAMPADAALAYLRSFPGVGPKTAACVLLFACRQPVLPVDTHVHRLSLRLGLIPARTSADKAHEALTRLVPKRHVLEFHVLLIRHGRTVCDARAPQCTECLLVDGCPEGIERLRSGAAAP